MIPKLVFTFTTAVTFSLTLLNYTIREDVIEIISVALVAMLATLTQMVISKIRRKVKESKCLDEKSKDSLDSKLKDLEDKVGGKDGRKEDKRDDSTPGEGS